MAHPVWQWLVCLTAVSFPAFLVRRGRHNLAVVVALANGILGCAGVVVDPEGRTPILPLVCTSLVICNLVALWAPKRLERAVVGRVRAPAVKVVVTLLAVSVVPLGLIELGCRVLTGLGVLRYHRAIETVWRSGHDDWRLATITGDDHREPDPVLLWRPAARKPFNSDRFKGPEILDPKPADVVRVICYGDSLTDGPPKGGWPRWLEAMLRERTPLVGRRFEVLNAGVAGYSSYQGLLRFLQEVDRYRPDLLLVSFGWNDAAEAIGQPDKTFQIPPWPIVMCQRALVRYRAYLVLMHYTRQWRAEPPAASAGPSHPRVSLADYLANMDRFRAEAEARGIPIAFLTRPHKVPADVLANDHTWRGSVPAYNAELREWAEQTGVPLLDLERAFESLPTDLFSDECHFVPAGYQKVAEIVRERLIAGSAGKVQVAGGTARTPVEGSKRSALPRRLAGPASDAVPR